jgi:hypothetical protein
VLEGVHIQIQLLHIKTKQNSQQIQRYGMDAYARGDDSMESARYEDGLSINDSVRYRFSFPSSSRSVTVSRVHCYCFLPCSVFSSMTFNYVFLLNLLSQSSSRFVTVSRSVLLPPTIFSLFLYNIQLCLPFETVGMHHSYQQARVSLYSMVIRMRC